MESDLNLLPLLLPLPLPPPRTRSASRFAEPLTKIHQPYSNSFTFSSTGDNAEPYVLFLLSFSITLMNLEFAESNFGPNAFTGSHALPVWSPTEPDRTMKAA